MKRRTNKSWCMAVLLALAVILPGQVQAEQGNPNAVIGQPSPAQYDVIMEDDIEVPMRDGTILRAKVFRPDAEGRFPVIIERSPYNKVYTSDMVLGSHEFFPQRGYVFIVQDSRGRYTSEGLFQVHVDEVNDSYDTVEWAAEQHWSNGKVSVVGNSYSGMTALYAGIAQPPHLVCAIPMLTGSNLWTEWYHRGGALEFAFASNWAERWGPDLPQRLLSPEAFEAWGDIAAMHAVDPEIYSSELPIVDFAPTQMGEVNMFKDWASHVTDGIYWKEISPMTWFEEINVPMLHIGGYYDIFLGGTLKAWAEIPLRAASALARDNQLLYLGPWFHHAMYIQTSEIGEIDHGPGMLTPAFNDVRLAFLDYWMKDIKTDLYDLDNPVRYFNMGEGQWKSSPTWPAPGIEYTKFYFGGGKSGSIESLNDGTLSTSLPGEQAPQRYIYDPMDPTPTRGGGQLFAYAYGPDGSAESAGVDQRPVDVKSLTYTSDVLTEALQITGPVKAVLYAASSAVDTDWVVRVCDVYPDGTSINIVDGIQRARFRTSGVNPTLIEPGQVYAYEVDLWATSHEFQPGHRVRVTVNSSSYPRWSRNMNVAEYPEFATEWEVATNTVYLDPVYPSHVILPVLPK